jgi:hypothetical protein
MNQHLARVQRAIEAGPTQAQQESMNEMDAYLAGFDARRATEVAEVSCDSHEDEGGHPDEVCAYCATCVQCREGSWSGHLHGACRS